MRFYPELSKVRKSKEYKNWRKTVLERDGNKCTFCGNSDGPKEVDHIKRFIDFPELRLDVSNGRTLCAPCHKSVTYAKKECINC